MAERKTKTAAKKEELTPATQPSVSTEAVNLTLVDLQNLAQIVDVASRRGAFQGAELSSVGATYDKLVAFLKQATAGQPEATQEAALEAATTN